MRIAAFFLALLLAAPLPAAAQLAGGGSGGGSGAGPAASGGADGLPAGFNPASDFVSQAGLAVRVLFIGRATDGKGLTVSTQIVNTGEAPANVALIGPAPTAIDTQGVQYKLENIAGIGRCKQLGYDWVEGCMTNSNRVLHNSHFAHLQPGASTVMALTFSAPTVSESGFMSISMNFAVGAGDRVTNENRKDLRNFPITFPIIDLAAASAGQ